MWEWGSQVLCSVPFRPPTTWALLSAGAEQQGMGHGPGSEQVPGGTQKLMLGGGGTWPPTHSLHRESEPPKTRILLAQSSLQVTAAPADSGTPDLMRNPEPEPPS